MVKKLLLILLIILTTSCCQNQIKPNHIAINIGYGKDTQLGDLSKVDKGESYNIKDFSVEFIKDYKKYSNSLELNIIDHNYVYLDDRLKHSTSYHVKLWLTRNFTFNYFDLFIGGGVGCGYMNPTKDNKYIADSKFVSDLGIRAGIQKNFEKFSIRLEYMLHHFSAIWYDDSGENEDEIRVGFVFPFN